MNGLPEAIKDNLLKHGAGVGGLEDAGGKREECINQLRIRKQVNFKGKYSLSLPLSRKKSADLQLPVS